MKRIRLLQILVYVVFALLVLKDIAPDAYRGAIDGWNDGYRSMDATPHHSRLLSHVALDGASFTGKKDTVLKAGTDYSVQNISVVGDVRLNPDVVNTPWWFDVVMVALAIFILILLIRIVRNINKVLVIIYKGTMFNEACSIVLRDVGIALVLYSIANYAFERLNYIEKTYLVLPPLKAIDTSTFDLGAVLMAIFVFIIAEVFKQGSRLKEEQDLTI
ncbi:DUF2975 domain-containing protein [Inquilinus sp. KBS0705]|nr:DUF2975 domain-containing protein [Inquilinus sp. KBS0705]